MHPTVLGEYRVMGLLGVGGMGHVYEAVDSWGHSWAIKTLTSADPVALLRFKREAEVLAAMDHPHILRLHDASLQGSPPFLVTDLLRAGSLEDRLRSVPCLRST